MLKYALGITSWYQLEMRQSWEVWKSLPEMVNVWENLRISAKREGSMRSVPKVEKMCQKVKIV